MLACQIHCIMLCVKAAVEIFAVRDVTCEQSLLYRNDSRHRSMSGLASRNKLIDRHSQAFYRHGRFKVSLSAEIRSLYVNTVVFH